MEQIVRVDDMEAAIGKLKDPRFCGVLEIPFPENAAPVDDVLLKLGREDIHGKTVKTINRSGQTVVIIH